MNVLRGMDISTTCFPPGEGREVQESTELSSPERQCTSMPVSGTGCTTWGHSRAGVAGITAVQH